MYDTGERSDCNQNRKVAATASMGGLQVVEKIFFMDAFRLGENKNQTKNQNKKYRYQNEKCIDRAPRASSSMTYCDVSKGRGRGSARVVGHPMARQRRGGPIGQRASRIKQHPRWLPAQGYANARRRGQWVRPTYPSPVEPLLSRRVFSLGALAIPSIPSFAPRVHLRAKPRVSVCIGDNNIQSNRFQRDDSKGATAAMHITHM